MKKTKKKIELPLVEPLYSTYHYQGPGTAVLVNNPSIRNWYLNQVKQYCGVVAIQMLQQLTPTVV